ncbi:hypothetical protein JNUCC31_15475 [Paenibacillus sp. JNUCC31]|uniref:hypothetical protein n=1 Tax=Paenibacillus sp. JNUCC-31 TaxID=2777983 RepID=UPI00177E113E|nr:hypothetical protein [Paenibacillus sp. JNUCC-31]QOS82103.1 hypothetical protein JNUCC31_15475 [Paenibacillus sp. JNUCC-31]
MGTSLKPVITVGKKNSNVRRYLLAFDRYWFDFTRYSDIGKCIRLEGTIYVQATGGQQ